MLKAKSFVCCVFAALSSALRLLVGKRSFSSSVAKKLGESLRIIFLTNLQNDIWSYLFSKSEHYPKLILYSSKAIIIWQHRKAFVNEKPEQT